MKVESYSRHHVKTVDELKALLGIEDTVTKQDFIDGKIAITIRKDDVASLNQFLKTLNQANTEVVAYDNVTYHITGNKNGTWKACTDKTVPTMTYTEFKEKSKASRGVVIGMKLIDKDSSLLVQYALKGYGAPIPNFANLTLTFQNHMAQINAVRRLKLEDLFANVYQAKATLPTVIGYNGVDKGARIEYGCANLEKSWFKSSGNRTITTMTLSSGVTISATEMELIRKYVTENPN